jgi:hypothetical protein
VSTGTGQVHRCCTTRPPPAADLSANQIERLLERVMFLLRPYREDELYPGREDEPDLGDDFGW